ncbi:MAG: hypothetical protein ACAH83_01650 [Alphaproteobacteria bacterium]
MTDDVKNEEVFEKLNDYTLSVSNDFARQSRADPELRRIFNFKARQVTNIYSMWYSSGITSTMTIQKFSELDSLDEVKDMHKKLCELGGDPPGLPDIVSPVNKGKSLSL